MSDFPHAVILTRDWRPSSVWLLAVLGVSNVLKISLDGSKGEADYVRQCVKRLRRPVPCFEPCGFVVNFSETEAVRYDLRGNVVERLNAAKTCGHAWIELEV